MRKHRPIQAFGKALSSRGATYDADAMICRLFTIRREFGASSTGLLVRSRPIPDGTMRTKIESGGKHMLTIMRSRAKSNFLELRFFLKYFIFGS